MTLLVHETGFPEVLMTDDREATSVVSGEAKKLVSSAYSDDVTCPVGSKCTSLQSCRLIKQLMNQNCLASNKYVT